MFNAELSLIAQLNEGKVVKGLSDLAPLDFSSLRTGIAAGSPVLDKVMRRLTARMNLSELTVAYGQTETSRVTVMSSTTDPLCLRCTTVGRVMPHTAIKIVNPQHPMYPGPETQAIEVGKEGELWSGGYAVFKGYWGDEAETRKSTFEKDGMRWMKTGDLAVMDKEGYVKICGRIKDIIIRGGENLFPVIIENRALTLQGIANCFIVAVADPVMLEAVGAFVKRDDSPAGKNMQPQDLCKHLTESISHQAAPEWDLVFG